MGVFAPDGRVGPGHSRYDQPERFRRSHHTWLISFSDHSLQELQLVPEGQPGDRFDDLYAVYRGKWRHTPIIRVRSELGRALKMLARVLAPADGDFGIFF